MKTILAAVIASLFVPSAIAQTAPRAAPNGRTPAQPSLTVRIKDIANIRGIRSNQLVGYGLVIGLNGTGDGKGSPTAASLANMLQRFDQTIRAVDLKVKNVAAVIVTADLPAFMSPGGRIDVVVSSLGDATSLQGGTLLQTPLMGADGKVYAVSQGQLSIGGFSVGNKSNGIQKNHPTVGRIPDGASVERSVPMGFEENGRMTVELRRPDFATATRIVDAIRAKYPDLEPEAVDAGSIRLTIPDGIGAVSVMAGVQALTVVTDQVAKIVVNERTGVVIIGGDVRIKPVIIAQGGIKVEVRTDYNVSQPPPLSKQGATVVTPTKAIEATEEAASITSFGGAAATVEDLVKGLQSLGVTPQDLIAILQALKQQGAIEAEVEVQ